jgi:hypothetical protein
MVDRNLVAENCAGIDQNQNGPLPNPKGALIFCLSERGQYPKDEAAN